MSEQPQHPDPPGWLIAAVDQRAALVEDALRSGSVPMAQDIGFLVVPLAEPPEGSPSEVVERWERTCDNCHKDCREDVFYTGTCTRLIGTGKQVIFTYGCCQGCSNLPAAD